METVVDDDDETRTTSTVFLFSRTRSTAINDRATRRERSSRLC